MVDSSTSSVPDIDFRANPGATFYVLSGPGGTGKTTLIKRWRQECSDLGYVANITTRKPRPQHRADESGLYQFVSRGEFRRLVEAKAFAQWVNPSEGKYYGTPIAPLEAAIAEGRDLVFDYTPQLYINLRRQFREQVVGIFIVPPTFSELLRRLHGRGTETGEELYIKEQMALQDLGYIDEHHYHVVNDDLEGTVSTLKAIRVAERHSLQRIGRIRELCRSHSPRTMMFYYDALGTRVTNISPNNDPRSSAGGARQ
ncbi:guanylate kinase [Ramlibacter tataouinensis]|uniref:Guanylate kinase (GMP kinase)-like protein n=1 Tax=Ramlibacter tataouinensis (strain ATCC BAA-407 / DSM 14655 / LMG 21543 / TTB310) TaxID=365046 RepID=F5XXB7_RAMTT|nr:guanylate kinase [Ramlibacter tataouinensis]AEG94252.1 guanylate kinase (GMP kinase)-like protein [Ramlibacter tataouinensis TTB310]